MVLVLRYWYCSMPKNVSKFSTLTISDDDWFEGKENSNEHDESDLTIDWQTSVGRFIFSIHSLKNSAPVGSLELIWSKWSINCFVLASIAFEHGSSIEWNSIGLRWRIGENLSLPLWMSMAMRSTDWCVKRSLSDATHQWIDDADISLSRHRSTTEWCICCWLDETEQPIDTDRIHSNERYSLGRWFEAWEYSELGACASDQLFDEVLFRIDEFVLVFVDENSSIRTLSLSLLLLFTWRDYSSLHLSLNPVNVTIIIIICTVDTDNRDLSSMEMKRWCTGFCGNHTHSPRSECHPQDHIAIKEHLFPPSSHSKDIHFESKQETDTIVMSPRYTWSNQWRRTIWNESNLELPHRNDQAPLGMIGQKERETIQWHYEEQPITLKTDHSNVSNIDSRRVFNHFSRAIGSSTTKISFLELFCLTLTSSLDEIFLHSSAILHRKTHRTSHQPLNDIGHAREEKPGFSSSFSSNKSLGNKCSKRIRLHNVGHDCRSMWTRTKAHGWRRRKQSERRIVMSMHSSLCRTDTSHFPTDESGQQE